jgi:hypothetical protein
VNPASARRIPLTGVYALGRHAIVDPGDWEAVRPYTWFIQRTLANTSRCDYVTGYIFDLPARDKRRSLARVLTGWDLTGHISGDTLDCRRENLIELDKSLQQLIRPTRPGSASRFKGVTAASRPPGCWRAIVSWRGTRYRLGTFAAEEDAARAYDSAVLELAGDAAPYVMTNQRMGLLDAHE